MNDDKRQPETLPDDETKILSRNTLGDVLAEDVSEEDFLEQYADQYCEWVQGIVIKKAPIAPNFEKLFDYVHDLLSSYISIQHMGNIATVPYVMRLAAVKSYRQPDIQVILGDNVDNLTDVFLNGPADLCVEIISPGSVKIDYGEKLEAYEKGGVREYWIIDPIRRECHFYTLQANGKYQPVEADANGNYTTSLLPRFYLSTHMLWEDDFPDMPQIVQSVYEMLK